MLLHQFSKSSTRNSRSCYNGNETDQVPRLKAIFVVGGPRSNKAAATRTAMLTASGLVEVHIDALQLQVGVALVGAGGVDAVLIADDLPELGTNLVAALAAL